MSASLKSSMAGNRDAFAAYICDETALDVLRPVVIELGWQPEKCNKGGLRNAIQSLSVAASPNILMVDLSESGDPLNDINALAEVCEPGTVVIAIGQVNDVRLYRDLLASGIHDYLLKPLSAASEWHLSVLEGTTDGNGRTNIELLPSESEGGKGSTQATLVMETEMENAYCSIATEHAVSYASATAMVPSSAKGAVG